MLAGFRWLFGLMLGLALGGCGGPQSALDPAGRGAEEIAELFWWMFGGGLVVWILVVGLALYAIRVEPGPHDARKAKLFIIGGGTVLPTLVLAGYLVYGLSLLPRLVEPAPPGSLEIAVTGERFWWRVRYEGAGGAAVELANELHLPVGEPVELRLTSPDVIHAFWVPALGGKMDMIPGRTNRLKLEPTRTGTFRGACAEFCGASHALMSFYVVVEPRADFERWLAAQAEAAGPPSSPLLKRGQRAFLANGCGACHAVRGTEADGVLGPDLTHVGSRLSLAAGALPNTRDDFYRWLARTEAVKPGVHMPTFGMLPEDDLHALAAYLDSLE